MSPQVLASIQRAAIMILVASLMTGQAYMLGSLSEKEAGAAIFGATAAAISRFGEGLYDSRRQSMGNVQSGDVTAQKG